MQPTSAAGGVPSLHRQIIPQETSTLKEKAMNIATHANVANSRPAAIDMTLSAVVAVCIAGVVMVGSITPAAAAKQASPGRAAAVTLTVKPVVRNHRNGVQVRDHRGS
jgi:hypothetical protein